MTTLRTTVTVGDWEIEMSRDAKGACRLAVRGRPFGLETVASDDEVRHLVKSLTKVIEERRKESR